MPLAAAAAERGHHVPQRRRRVARAIILVRLRQAHDAAVLLVDLRDLAVDRERAVRAVDGVGGELDVLLRDGFLDCAARQRRRQSVAKKKTRARVRSMLPGAYGQRKRPCTPWSP